MSKVEGAKSKGAKHDELSVPEAIKLSGYPLQTRVAFQLMQATRRDWGWISPEYAWYDTEKSRTSFIDVVATKTPKHYSGTACTAVIECKKSSKKWVFLNPRHRPDVDNANGFIYAPWVRGASTGSPILWQRFRCEPESITSSFSVIAKRGDAKESTELLDHTASDLVRASLVLAQELYGRGPRDDRPVEGCVMPVIVTNAILYSAEYSPESVDEESGEVGDEVTIKPERWVRFEKEFTRHGQRMTVFVVSATNLKAFLDMLNPNAMPDENVALKY